MNDDTDLDRIRGAALDQVDKARQWYWRFFWATGLCELVLLVLFLVLMDFGEPLHVLLLVMALLIYWTLGSAIIALGAYLNLSTQRILHAIELSSNYGSSRDEP